MVFLQYAILCFSCLGDSISIILGIYSAESYLTIQRVSYGFFQSSHVCEWSSASCVGKCYKEICARSSNRPPVYRYFSVVLSFIGNQLIVLPWHLRLVFSETADFTSGIRHLVIVQTIRYTILCTFSLSLYDSPPHRYPAVRAESEQASAGSTGEKRALRRHATWYTDCEYNSGKTLDDRC